VSRLRKLPVFERNESTKANVLIRVRAGERICRFREEKTLKSSKRRQLDEDDLVVKITSSSGGQQDIVIRSTRESIRLAGDDYVRFQIIRPKGYEKEKIVHRLNRGYEELLTSVFLTLSEARSARRGGTMRRQHLKLPLPT
jgi:hypothetical protein